MRCPPPVAASLDRPVRASVRRRWSRSGGMGTAGRTGSGVDPRASASSSGAGADRASLEEALPWNRIWSWCRVCGLSRSAGLDSKAGDSLPVVAFSVGGIPEWLIDGVNGFLAPGDPPSSFQQVILQIIVRCLSDPPVSLSSAMARSLSAKRFNLSQPHKRPAASVLVGLELRASFRASGRKRSSTFGLLMRSECLRGAVKRPLRISSPIMFRACATGA